MLLVENVNDILLGRLALDVYDTETYERRVMSGWDIVDSGLEIGNLEGHYSVSHSTPYGVVVDTMDGFFYVLEGVVYVYHCGVLQELKNHLSDPYFRFCYDLKGNVDGYSIVETPFFHGIVPCSREKLSREVALRRVMLNVCMRRFL